MELKLNWNVHLSQTTVSWSFLWQVCQKLESVIYSQLFLRFPTSTPHTSSEILGWESCLFPYLAKTSTALLSRGTSWNLQVSAISPRQLPSCHRCTRQEQWEEWAADWCGPGCWGPIQNVPHLFPRVLEKSCLQWRAEVGLGGGCGSDLQFTRHFESAIISRTVDRELLDYQATKKRMARVTRKRNKSKPVSFLKSRE